MARHIIKTTVTFYYESDDNEFQDEKSAEEFGWHWDDMIYDGVDRIEVEELENEFDDEEDEDEE